MSVEKRGLRILVRGIVQGVGFRPYVHNLANDLGLTGWVKNTSNGVEIELVGAKSALNTFVNTLHQSPPPLARIDRVDQEVCEPGLFSSFEIISSQPLPGEFLPISPDMCTCDDCRRELFDPANRRFRYPFINCTNCGPRFSIIQDIPYDRPLTTMAGFPMCQECEREYHDPRDRRFHAQPVACPVCGPQVSLVSHGMQIATGDTAVQITREWLKKGKIIAVKGLGGYHLACDATNPDAVGELRRRKKRSAKPFALMAFDLASVRRYCVTSGDEEDLLTSRERPVVLLKAIPGAPVASELVAPQLSELGVMLAYTPLHLLLLEPAPGFPDMLVMTSGNLQDEPIAFEDVDAANRLDHLADAFLVHNRPIHIRVDDSVVAGFQARPYFYRRARGYAPDPIRLNGDFPPILAVGPELKNTFCLLRENYAFLSHHIGDMENMETYRSFEEGIRHFEHVFHVKPASIACDLHPNYLSTHYAENRSQIDALPLIKIQHHHAHLAACLADNEWNSPEEVIGLCFDGTGYGLDGAIWGGEILVGGYAKCQRLYHLEYTPLPGGDRAIRNPARMALAYLWRHQIEWHDDLPPFNALCEEERTILRSQLEHQINTPLTSSMGRLFDAVSSLIGVCHQTTYEGQPAIELEALADPEVTGTYRVDFENGHISIGTLLRGVVDDQMSGVPRQEVAGKFHNSIADMAIEASLRIRAQMGFTTVALSGGVWQNRLLLHKATDGLRKAGFRTLLHRRVPANDGGVSLGQALIAAWQAR